MKITDLLKPEAITLGLDVSSRGDVINALVGLHAAAGSLNDKDAYKAAILEREAQGATAVGDGIAVPHAKTKAVKYPALSAVTVRGGVDFGAPDSKPSDLFFMIAAPQDSNDYLEILSRLMIMLMDGDFAGALRKAQTPQDFLRVIDECEKAKYPESGGRGEPPRAHRVLAVTACNLDSLYSSLIPDPDKDEEVITPTEPDSPSEIIQEEGYYLESGNPSEYFSTEATEAEISNQALILTTDDGTTQEYPMMDNMILLGSDILTITQEDNETIAITKEGTEPLVFRYGRR